MGTWQQNLRGCILLRRLRIAFDPVLERAFIEDYRARVGAQTIVAFAIGVVLFALFGFTDVTRSGDRLAFVWTLRYGLGVPVLLATLGFLYAYPSSRFTVPVLSAALIFLTWVTCAIKIAVFDEAHYLSTETITLILFFTFVFSRLLWKASLFTGIAIASSYLATLAYFNAGAGFLVMGGFSLLSILVMGAGASYFLESQARTEFLARREMEQVNRRLFAAARTDTLTGVANRSAVIDAMQAAEERRRNSGERYAVLLVDVDDFKKVNDQHGHAAGDSVLVEVARVLVECVRGSDIVGRWGGEEFVVLLAATDRAAAQIVASHVLERMRGRRIAVDNNLLSVTLTIGMADCEEADGGQAVLNIADRRLYAGKESGKDRAVA